MLIDHRIRIIFALRLRAIRLPQREVRGPASRRVSFVWKFIMLQATSSTVRWLLWGMDRGMSRRPANLACPCRRPRPSGASSRNQFRQPDTHTSRHKGYTLLELLLAMILAGLVITVLLPPLHRDSAAMSHDALPPLYPQGMKPRDRFIQTSPAALPAESASTVDETEHAQSDPPP